TLGSVADRTDRELAAFLQQTRTAFFEIEGLLVLFLFLTIVSYPVVRTRILRPVARLRAQTLGLAGDLSRLTDAIEHIAGGGHEAQFAVRTPMLHAERPDEIGDLSRLHDVMLAKLGATGAAISTITAELSSSRRKAEAARDLTERRFASIFRESPVALLVSERDTGVIRAANIAAARLVGAGSVEELLGRRTLDVGIWGGDEARRRESLSVVGPRNRVAPTRMPLVLPSGEVRTIDAMASAYEFEGESFILSSLMDITDRLRAEEERRKAERAYLELFQGVRDVVFSLDLEGAITMLNPAFETVFQQPVSEWIGRSYRELIVPEDRARAEAQLQATLDGHPPSGLPLRLRAGDRTVLAEIRSSPRSEDGRIVGIFGIARDVSDRASLEEQLRQSQKMEALGTLSGGIAHDFNNILTAINGNAELALEDTESGDPVHRSLLDIRKAGQRAKDLVRQILLFSRREESRRKALDLIPVIEEAIRLLRTSLPKSITIVTELGTAPAFAQADPTQVHQIMMNLGTNAGHAMGEKGTLTVRLDRVELGPRREAMTPDLPDGAYHRLAVTDTGSGMSPETLARIFEPFFTTKGNAGTGLGLSVVHGIMRDHEGAIAVESTPGKGTTFFLHFPVTSERQAEAASATVPRARGAGQRILLVDDEEALVQVTSRILERLGYTCTTFTSAPEALAAFRADPMEFDAVITDVSMPLMNGLELALHAKDLRPDLPIALSTGAPEDRDLAERAGITVQFR
ncbi:MAG TPA: PAS domain S-box protein, partial [Gemmatimonadales bacterium]|nr:PAS domain S-box protein [Gemmatimonadales bacterium]